MPDVVPRVGALNAAEPACAAAEAAPAIWDEVKDCALLSLDVFDTVLTRACGPPQALYLWLGRRLSRQGIIKCSAEVFARARARAEEQVWDRAGGMDSNVGLADFYHEVVRLLWLDQSLVRPLVQAELQLEEEVLRSLPQAQQLIAQAQQAGTRIVFASDTYFDREYVERQLQRKWLWPPGSMCLASSELAMSKASGRLFDRLLTSCAVPAKAVVHVGDNRHSDLAMPRSKGLRTRLLPDAQLNRYELALAQEMWATDGMAAALAGASRLARLQTSAGNPRQEAIRDVAAGVAAPILVGYVLWLLHRACDLGLDRLYFIARDGQILAGVAASLAGRLQYPIEIRYLCASRQSVNLAATFEADDEELAWVFRDAPDHSPRSLLQCFDIAWEEASRELDQVDPDSGSTSVEAGKVMAAFLRSDRGRALLLARAAERRRVVAGYLGQEGLLDGSRCGLVDFGGVGSQMRALYVLLEKAGNPPPRMFLMGLDDYQNSVVEPPSANPRWLQQTECYLYDHRRHRGIRRARGFGSCVQMFCAADHGTVKGYRRDNGRIVPVLEPEFDQSVVDWGLPLFQETVLRFTEQLKLDPELIDARADLRHAACRVIQMFWSEPTLEEARAWGAFPFEGAQAAGGAAKPLARGYSWLSVIAGTLDRSFPDLGWQHWYEGSLRMSSPGLRVTLRAAERAYRKIERGAHPWSRKIVNGLRRLLRGSTA